MRREGRRKEEERERGSVCSVHCQISSMAGASNVNEMRNSAASTIEFFVRYNIITLGYYCLRELNLSKLLNCPFLLNIVPTNIKFIT